MRNWNELSMAEKADVMKLAIDGGVYDLDAIRSGYNEYAKGGKKNQNTWTMEDEAKYREWRDSLPDNLRNTNDNLYDMRGAYKAGMEPTLESDGYYHLGSRDPKTGRILKSPMHPTFLQALATDASMGYYPVTDNQGNTYTQTWEGNKWANGGNIHIKPSHRGRLTELKERTGKSEAELYNDGNPAHKKMVVFARNARKWKHEDGGLLEIANEWAANKYDGYNPNSQQMQFGSAYWQQQAQKPLFNEELADFNRRKAEENRQKRAELNNWMETTGKEIASKRQKDYLTTSNDNTLVEKNNSRTKNSHLVDRSVEGAKAHEAWAKAHPIMNGIGLGLGVAPFAVASIPLAGAAIESAPAVASALAPGSAFWMNPAVQQTAASMLGGKAVDLTTMMLTPYGSWGEGVSDLVDQTTGWNPQDSWYGSMLADITNPGYLLPYNTIANNTIKASNYMGDKFNEAKDFVKDVTWHVRPERMEAVNSAFRNSEWSNFLSTRNGDNYYRMVNPRVEKYSPKEKYFLSHTTPWEEFSGKGTEFPIGTTKLYEFPTETFGQLRATTSSGLPTEFNVAEMGRQHLLYGNTASGIHGPVRIMSDANAKFLGESPFRIRLVDRPLTENGLFNSFPIYEDIINGANQTVLKGKTIQRALDDATYNVFEKTPFGITKTIHMGK